MNRLLIILMLLSFVRPICSQDDPEILVFPLGSTPDSLYRAGYFRKALPYAMSAFDAFGYKPVLDTATYAKAMYRLGVNEYQAGYYDRAFPHLKEAFSLYYGATGMNDDTCARMCCALAHALVRALHWEEDDAMLTRMIAEAEKSPGVSVFARTSLRWCQGNVYHNQRKYAQARQIYEQCKADWEAISATRTGEYCLMIYALSALYEQLDDTDKSMQLDRTGLELHRQVYGAGHPGEALFINGLAHKNRLLENWTEAMAFYEEIIRILREKVGDDAWLLGMVYFNMGILNRQLGDYAQAEYFHELALRISLQSHGKSHSEYPMIISELGRTAQLRGDLDKADSLLNVSLLSRIDILGKKHPFYPAGLMDVAALYLEKNQPDAAYPLLSEALKVQIEIEGPRHSSVVATLQKIAYCSLLQGRFAEADSVMRLSGDLFGAIYGDDGQTIAKSRDNQILTRMCMYPDDDQILAWAKQGHEIWKKTARRAMSYASPNQLESLLFSLSFHNNIINTVSARQYDAGLAYDNALLFKNLALQSRSRWFRQTNILKDAASVENFRHWQQIQHRLNNELNKPQSQRRQIDSLEYILQQTERNFAAFTGPDDNIIPNWHTVQDSLDSREAAVEFIHYTIPKPLSDGNTTHYAALLLLPGEPSPRFIPLFEEAKLTALLEKQTGSAESVASLYTRSGYLLDDNPQYGKELYELVWKPVGQLLPGRVRTVYVALSGLLHRVNITALPVSKKRVVADLYTIRQTGSTRSIVLGKPDSRETNPTAMLLGGIQYQSDSTELGREVFAFQTDDRARGMSGLSLAETRDTGIVWDYLQGTEQEVVQCARLLGKAGFDTVLCTGLSATEERVKKTGSGEEHSPGVLHLATHGYFFQAPASTGVSAPNNFVAHQHPLFRSGLLLAGADYAWRTGKPFGGREDGILTAYEISHLNLSDTRLAVLSACQTGLGDIRGAEGVYGLQRAFKMAGVDYLLVSLWQVPDQETADFMEAFYAAWTGGNTIHSAFAKAQKQMRKKYKKVYQWGAWVLVE